MIRKAWDHIHKQDWFLLITNYESPITASKKKGKSSRPSLFDLAMLFRSTLAELETSPGASLSVLFTLNLACVTGQIARLFKRFPEVVGDLE